MSQQHPSQPPATVVPLKIADALLTAGLTHGGPFYLIYEQPSQCFHIVWWERLRWHCSCTRKKCAHTRAVSSFLLEALRKHQITEDDLGLNR